MTSEKQIAANRRNAQKSTGPKDTLKTRYNRLWHGLRGSRVVLPHESMEEYLALADTLYHLFKPAGTYEHFLVKRIADRTWELERIVGLKSETMIQCEFRDEMIKELQLLEKYEASMERSIYRSRRELGQVQKARGASFILDEEEQQGLGQTIAQTETWIGPSCPYRYSEGEVAFDGLLAEAKTRMLRSTTTGGRISLLDESIDRIADLELSTQQEEDEEDDNDTPLENAS